MDEVPGLLMYKKFQHRYVVVVSSHKWLGALCGAGIVAKWHISGIAVELK